MKQPELGKKISELRKARGLTQEELVDKCNISVRTLQRIETGEVTPRSYTIRTILAALEADAGTLGETDESLAQAMVLSVKQYLLLNVDVAAPPEVHVRQLTIAWSFGLLSFLIGFFEGAAEYFRYEEHVLIFSTWLYVSIKIAALVTFIIFQRGFILVGGLFNNYLLRITSFMLIAGTILVVGYDIASVFYDSIERQFVLGSEAIVFGCIGILYGVSLSRLQASVGSVARIAGVFVVLTGCLFLTVVLSFLGFIMEVPGEILQIIILFKSVDIVKSRQEKAGHVPQQVALT